MEVHFDKLGKLFKERGLMERERTPAWIIALALAVYTQGLSLRRTALVLRQLGVRISHVSVWYWIQTFANKWSVWQEALPKQIVVDETVVKLGGRKCYIWAAIDPKTRKVLYFKVSRDRWLKPAKDFFREMAQEYGQWAKEAIVDGGPWYQGALFSLGKTQRVRMVGGVRNYVERHFRELKRRLKVFDVAFPQHTSTHDSINNWLRTFAWHYNRNIDLKEFFALS